MCCREHRVNRPGCTMLTLLKLSFSSTSSLMNIVRFGTIIPCIRGEVQEYVSCFGQNH